MRAATGGDQDSTLAQYARRVMESVSPFPAAKLAALIISALLVRLWRGVAPAMARGEASEKLTRPGCCCSGGRERPEAPKSKLAPREWRLGLGDAPGHGRNFGL